MRAGLLHHRIALQSISAYSKNKAGEKIPTWTTYDTVWANIEPAGGGESVRGVSSESEVTHEITIRFQSTVSPKHRVVDEDSRVFYIDRILNKREYGVWQVMKCTEVVT